MPTRKEEAMFIVPDVGNNSISDLVSLSGRTAVVTGAARGIGYAIADRLSEAGACVVVADLDKSAADRVAAEISDKNSNICIAAEVDVTNECAVKELADRAVHEFGGVNIWVNNAGIYPITPLFEVTEEQWDHVLAVNLKGAFVGSREAARRMIAGDRRGVIINLSSVAGYRASSLGGTEYVAAKHGVRGLTRALAAQLGPYGIRVLGLAPTTIDTPGIHQSRKHVAALGVPQVDANRERPLGRDGVPDDVGRIALFCASDLSILMTGSTLDIDGGTLILM